MKTLLAALAFATLLSSTAAQASVVTVLPSGNPGTISINFDAADSYIGPTLSPGLVYATNWNNVYGPSSAGVALVDSSGALTTARLGYSSTGTWGGFGAPATANADLNAMYRSAIYTSSNGGLLTISLTNIPYALFDVYVYASADTANTSTLSMSDGLMTYYYASAGSGDGGAPALLQTVSQDPLNPTRGAAQYQVFSNETRRAITFSAGGGMANVISNNVFGLQIVDRSNVPEPGSLALTGLAFGVVAMLARGRGRRA